MSATSNQETVPDGLSLYHINQHWIVLVMLVRVERNSELSLLDTSWDFFHFGQELK